MEEKKKPRQLYFKLFWTYTAIVVCIVLVLVLYFMSASQRRNLEANRQAMEQVNRQAAEYVEETEKIADYVFSDLYRSASELEDLLAYFSMEPEEYQKYSLDRYSATAGQVYKGIHNFLNEAFEAYDNLEKVELIGYKNCQMTQCYPEKKFYPGKDGKSRLYQVENPDYGEEGKLLYTKQIRNPDTMENEGCMIFTFEGKQSFQRLARDNRQTNLVIRAGKGGLVFQQQEDENWESKLEDDRFLSQETAEGPYEVYTYLNIKKASRLSLSTFWAILGIGAAAVLAGVLCIGFYVRRLTRRVDAVLEAMNQVTTGNLQARLETGNKRDELDMIGSHFNEMCEKLDLYIQKSYLAEIEKKNAQMQALQSQINPHFLYNTLEAIRMRAICNGDREVGRMLYSMVVLFRSQLKEADVITLGQELDYCKQYMELFEYRYQDSFTFRVECPVELLSLPIIKFVLQPIIENYFIHGIDRDRKDNRVLIRAQSQGERLIISVEDNGLGMSREDMEEKNKILAANSQEETGNKSIGISNVNRRIKAVYGEEYGVFIQAAEPQGLQVRITIKVEKGEAYEKGNVSGG